MFYEHGFQAFISKPIDIMEMDSAIRKWVCDESQGKASRPGKPEPAPSADESIKLNIPGVDTAKGLSLYGGETDIYLTLLRSYVSNTPGILDRLRNVSPETLQDYVIAVHGLKGASAGVGVEEIRKAAQNLETLSRAGNIDGVKNDKLIEDTETVVANIKSWLEQYESLGAKPRLKAPDRELLARLGQCCENYDMIGIDQVLSELEGVDYEEDADLVTWLREKIDVSEIAEAAERLRGYAAK
jgi:HPt (histidine-containing phosphotransfer) domain-containing protein